jgi:hypothetical protein
MAFYIQSSFTFVFTPLDDDRALSTSVLYALFLLMGRGRLRIALGQPEDGVADLLEVGRRRERWGMQNPAPLPWRSHAALALIGLRDQAEAVRLAHEELDLAQAFGAPTAIAMALRACALEGAPGDMIALLSDAASLADSPALLTKAHVLVELGAVLRRENQRSASREPLLRGLQLAERCGARPLAERARHEIEAAGAQARSVVRTGADALTPSERRVARMAAAAMSTGRSRSRCSLRARRSSPTCTPPTKARHHLTQAARASARRRLTTKPPAPNIHEPHGCEPASAMPL